MKVVYVFLSPSQGLYHLMQTILPQLESGMHSLEIVGMCFFNDNAHILDRKHPYAEKLLQTARHNNIMLMKAETQDLQPGATRKDFYPNDVKQARRLKPTECAVITIVGEEQVGCFPDIYTALGSNRPDRIISL